MGEKKALVLASANYLDPNLPALASPIPDAKRLAEVLRKPGLGDFDVRVLIDPDLVEAQEAIYRLFGSAAPDDIVLVHLSGHGLRDSVGRFYFALSETKSGALVATSLSGRFIREQMGDSACRNIVLILDCCYAGAFGRDLIAKSYVPSSGVPEDFKGDCRAILTASSAVQSALEETLEVGASSVSTKAIIEGIATGAADLNDDGVITISEIFQYSSTEVGRRFDEQTPQLSLLGVSEDLPIARVSRSGLSVTGIDEDVASALHSHHLPLRLAAVEVLEHLMESRDPSRAASAKKRLRISRGDPHPVVRLAIEKALASAPKGMRRTLPLLVVENSPERAQAWVEVQGRSLAAASLSLAAVAGDDPSLPALTQVLLKYEPSGLTLVSTNRFILAYWRLPVLAGGEYFKAPVSAIDLISVKAFSTGRPVRIDVSTNRVEVISGKKFLLLDIDKSIEYPPVETLVERRGEDVPIIQVSRSSLLDAVERVVNQMDRFAPVGLKWAGRRAGEIKIVSLNDDLKLSESIVASGERRAVTVAFNPTYLSTILGNFRSRSIEVLITEATKPVFFTSREEPGHVELVMPIRMSP